MTAAGPGPRALFVNSGILGLLSFQHFLDEYLPRQSAIRWDRLVLAERLTLPERVVRRVICQRLWKDGLFGVSNLDLARFRHELHAGLLARHRMRGAYDVLHFHNQATAYGSLDLLRRTPAIVSADCTQECVIETARTRVERSTYRPNVMLDGVVFNRAAAIVARSQWAADSIRALYPRCETPIHVMPNPVLLDRFDPAWIERRRARSEAVGKVRVLFLGGDFSRKGGYTLLDAWEAGGFAERAELRIVTQARIDRPLPSGASVTPGVAGHSEAWRSLWADADLFVLPTRNEAFGIVFQEAAAAGLPAIGTRHHAIPEIIGDGETGLLVPVDDRDALVDAMSALIDDPGRRAELGTRARQRIEQVADPARYLERLVGLMLAAVRNHGS